MRWRRRRGGYESCQRRSRRRRMHFWRETAVWLTYWGLPDSLIERPGATQHRVVAGGCRRVLGSYRNGSYGPSSQ